jgi:hypothetical protein
MIILTSLHRDFLDRYFIGCMNGYPDDAYIFGLCLQHGFTYDHFMKLSGAYKRSWGNNWNAWVGSHLPPVSPEPNPPIFPWSSIQELEAQLDAEEAEKAERETAGV